MKKRWAILLSIIIGLIVIFGIQRERMLIAAAIIMSERRPSLLDDAEWNNPQSARAVREKFAPGTQASELLFWLGKNDFIVNHQNFEANKIIKSLPCQEEIQIDWTQDQALHIRKVSALISERGCF